MNEILKKCVHSSLVMPAGRNESCIGEDGVGCDGLLAFVDSYIV